MRASRDRRHDAETRTVVLEDRALLDVELDEHVDVATHRAREVRRIQTDGAHADRKSTRLNSSHGYISYAVFCLKKKTNTPSRSPPVSALAHSIIPRASYSVRDRSPSPCLLLASQAA